MSIDSKTRANYSNGVPGVIINAKSPRPIVFLNQEYRWWKGTHAWLNNSILKHSPNLCLNFLLLKIRVSVGPNIHWCRIRKEMNGVIGWPRRGQGGESMVEINSWIPAQGAPQWNLLARRCIGGNFVYNCAVMGCWSSCVWFWLIGISGLISCERGLIGSGSWG